MKLFNSGVLLKQYLAPGLFTDWLCRRLFSLSSSARIATLFLFWNPIKIKFTRIIVNFKAIRENENWQI